MKKYLILTINLLLILCSCSQNQEYHTLEFENTIEEKASNPLFIEEKVVLMPSAAGENPVVLPISYASVNEMVNSIANDYTEDVLNVIEQSEHVENKGNFSKFISTTIDSNIIYVPSFNNKSIDLRTDKGYSAIDFSPIDRFGYPCIYYHMKYNNEDVLIKVTNLRSIMENDMLNEAKNKGVLWTINQINTDDSLSFLTLSYEEKSVDLMHETVKTLVEKPSDDSRIFVSFVCEDSLITVCAKESVISDNWFKMLSFEGVYIK